MKEPLEDLLDLQELPEELSLQPPLAPEGPDNPTYLGMKTLRTRKSTTLLPGEEGNHRTIRMMKGIEDLPEDLPEDHQEEVDQEEEDQEEEDQEEENHQIITPSIDYSAEDSQMLEDKSEDDHSTFQNIISI